MIRRSPSLRGGRAHTLMSTPSTPVAMRGCVASVASTAALHASRRLRKASHDRQTEPHGTRTRPLPRRGRAGSCATDATTGASPLRAPTTRTYAGCIGARSSRWRAVRRRPTTTRSPAWPSISSTRSTAEEPPSRHAGQIREWDSGVAQPVDANGRSHSFPRRRARLGSRRR